MRHIRPVVSCLFLLGVMAYAQDAYYAAIQKRSRAPIPTSRFQEMEENAFKDPLVPERYEGLTQAFGNSTEKVWAVVYGEVFCNLTTDEKRAREVGAMIFRWYDQALTKTPQGLSINLTENAAAPKKGAPFESNFELAFLLSAASLQREVTPLSIEAIAAIRKGQLSLWTQKHFDKTALMKWQEEIISAGHWEAYNYWLYREARPAESQLWIERNPKPWQAWTEWHRTRVLKFKAPDFQRLFLFRS